MALNQATLRAQIQRFFRYPLQPPSRARAAAEWANAYDTYARAATDVSGDAVTTVNRPGFQSALRFRTTNTSAQMAAELEQAFIAYWTGAVFAIGIPPATPTMPCPSVPPSPPWAVEASSVVLSVSSGLAALLVPIFESAAKSVKPASVVAAEIASAFHQATTSNVTVLITGITLPPPPGGVPVTNTCGVF